jgi:outer membrane protein OmpA-like peptidoglycan-associated protein
MKRILLSLGIMLFFNSTMNAQKKSDLIAEVASLKMQLDSVSSEITDARKKEKIAQTESESYKSQVSELQDANATLLKSLTSFTEVSSKSSSNFNKAMEQLNEKERQLKAINDAIASNDSTALVVLTNAKQTLGENAKIGVSNGMVLISSDLTSLFGSDTESKITAEAETWINKIGQILTANPTTGVTIEGLSMTGNLELPAQQASAVRSALQGLSIAPERISALGKDGNLKEGVVIKIHPKFDEFYQMVKDNMKNGN